MAKTPNGRQQLRPRPARRAADGEGRLPWPGQGGRSGMAAVAFGGISSARRRPPPAAPPSNAAGCRAAQARHCGGQSLAASQRATSAGTLSAAAGMERKSRAGRGGSRAPRRARGGGSGPLASRGALGGATRAARLRQTSLTCRARGGTEVGGRERPGGRRGAGEMSSCRVHESLGVLERHLYLAELVKVLQIKHCSALMSLTSLCN